MEEILSTPSTSSSASKKVAVTFIEGLRKRLFDSEATPRKVPFKALFTAVLFHLGRVLFQIVVTISGFFPTLVIVSHIGGFILERWLEILSTESGLLRLKKTTLTILQISILDMVCFLEDNLALCVIQDGNNSGSVKAKLLLPAFKTVADLYNEVGKIIKCHEDSFKLILQSNQNEYVSLEYFRTETIEMAGFKVGPDTKNTLFVLPSPDFELPKPHDLRVDSSSSPTESREYETSDAPPPPPPPPPASTSSTSADFDCTNTIIRPQIGYVGLVNQAMTCYLNSLLQALFMTPEFRNAIYNWEFDGSPNEESKSIPYQLQKLFLNLQTSRRSAVETTELTRSFGWDSWEAWQQHDIQELCRVMFDTLEQNFKNTKQADLINRLYEGKMIDYVKCLECSTEKSREDTFLDIPLSVRSFGSNVAYGSVEEALRAFVQPETLEGNNQYHCDTCNKKCDAHKGLKFSKFPYLLTLHLKRFDFDFNTLHRIKLNDKVSFPEKLNLNSFIAHAKGSESNSEASPEETAVKCDDSCTTDSGSALDDEGCQGIDPVGVPNSYENHNSDYQEDDEGIDVEQQQENEKNRQNACESGPYVYELFAIMIHSGSAAGGHYYVYIKDFKDGEWYCFNDQNVARITYDDIRKTYGGGPIRGYYSGAYSSSTNAYMLMYRQIDKEINAAAITVDEFPEHIKVLHRKMERQKEIDEQKELEEQKELDEERELEDQKELDDHKDTGSVIWNRFLSLFKIKIYCHYPHPNAVTDAKIYMKKEFTIRETLELVYRRLKLDKLVPIERCRLVSYDEVKEAIEYSFEGREDDTIGDTCIYLEHQNFLIDVREENEKFVVYKPGNINTLVILVNVETEEVIGPIVVKANLFQTVKEYKEIFAQQFKLPKGALHIVLEKFSHEPRLLRNDESTLKREGFYDGNKVYVATSLNDEDLEVQKSLILIKLQKIIDRFEHVITLHVALPDVDSEILARLNIPPLENSLPVNNCKPNEGLLNRGTSPGRRDPSPQLVQDAEDESMSPAGPHSDQSASEDSSLTDSERTIVGDTPGDCLAQISPNSSPVGSDQNVSSSENEGNDISLLKRNSYTGRLITDVHNNSEIENWDAEEEISNKPCNYFFQAVPYTENVSNQKILKVLVDERMSQGTFKQCLEPFVGVSVEHFKICRSYEKHFDLKCSRLSESYFKDEKLTVKLSRALKKGEYAGHVFLLVPNNEEFMKYLFEWVISNGTPVSQVKKEILEELKNKYAIEIPYNRCRLRRKNWKIPMRPYLDGTTFDDLVSDWEMFVQELPGEEPVTSPDKKLLIVRQLCPSTKKLKPFEEIVVDTNSVLECKEKISEISGIPVEFIDTAKAPVCFPSRSFSKFRISNLEVSVLAPYLDVDWNSTTTDNFTLNDYEEGNVILYRDNTKFFQPRDRKMSSKDRRIRLYSRTKERDLKIYLDGTPPRKDESDVD